MHFCVWSCIPVVSVERDVFHIQQLLLPSRSSWERFLRVPWTARRSNQSVLKGIILNMHWKDWCRSWSYNTLTIWCEELIHQKRPQCWERLKAGREGDGRGWNGWTASPTQWKWVWASSGNRWSTGRPGVLKSMGLQRVRHDRETEENRWVINIFLSFLYFLDELKPCLAARLIPLRWQRKCEKMCSLFGLSSVIQAHISLGKLYEL